MRSPKSIIFSPHVDDEVIGCFLALERGIITDVVYFYDVTDERKEEALRSAEKFGFTPWFVPNCAFGPDIPRELDIKKEDTIFCPTVKDTHAQHAQVSKAARWYKEMMGCNLVFYTVDMESFQVVLPEEFREKKKAALAELFPSQNVLLQNEKYHLFEGYSRVDHVEAVRFDVAKGLKVVLKGPSVNEGDILKPHENEQDADYLNRLINRYYNRESVTHIAIYRGNKSVEFNG